MNIKYKSLFITIVLTLTSTHSLVNAQTSTGTLSNLQGALTPYAQSDFDGAITGTGGEMETNYNNALTGTALESSMSAAVILQSNASGNNFGFIDQDVGSNSGFNYAIINQTTKDNNAYILQTGITNYASIVQSGAVATVGYISQTGDSNRAIINQR